LVEARFAARGREALEQHFAHARAHVVLALDLAALVRAGELGVTSPATGPRSEV
jgi:hypothetical protein